MAKRPQTPAPKFRAPSTDNSVSQMLHVHTHHYRTISHPRLIRQWCWTPGWLDQQDYQVPVLVVSVVRPSWDQLAWLSAAGGASPASVSAAFSPPVSFSRTPATVDKVVTKNWNTVFMQKHSSNRFGHWLTVESCQGNGFVCFESDVESCQKNGFLVLKVI